MTDETIRQIAAEEAHHVCESGAPNAKQHNARVVEQAIRRAMAEVNPDSDWDRWASEVLTDFKIPFDNHTAGLRLGITQWMADRLSKNL